MTDEKTKLTISRKVCVQLMSMQYTSLNVPTIHKHHAHLPAVVGWIVYEILIDLSKCFFMQHFQKLLLLLFKHDVLIMCDRFFES